MAALILHVDFWILDECGGCPCKMCGRLLLEIELFSMTEHGRKTVVLPSCEFGLKDLPIICVEGYNSSVVGRIVGGGSTIITIIKNYINLCFYLFF